jgi:hypothetical protein
LTRPVEVLRGEVPSAVGVAIGPRAARDPADEGRWVPRGRRRALGLAVRRDGQFHLLQLPAEGRLAEIVSQVAGDLGLYAASIEKERGGQT